MRNKYLKMDDKDITKMFIQSFMMQVYTNAGNVSNMTYIMSDIAKTWRYIEPEGPIGDKNIEELGKHVKDVFQSCQILQKETNKNMKIENLPEDKESLEKLFNEVKDVSDEMSRKFDAFVKLYLDLSKIFFKEEYKK